MGKKEVIRFVSFAMYNRRKGSVERRLLRFAR